MRLSPDREGKALCYWTWGVYFKSFQLSFITSALQNVKQFSQTLLKWPVCLSSNIRDQGQMSWHFPNRSLVLCTNSLPPTQTTNDYALCTQLLRSWGKKVEPSKIFSFKVEFHLNILIQSRTIKTMLPFCHTVVYLPPRNVIDFFKTDR